MSTIPRWSANPQDYLSRRVQTMRNMCTRMRYAQGVLLSNSTPKSPVDPPQLLGLDDPGNRFITTIRNCNGSST